MVCQYQAFTAVAPFRTKKEGSAGQVMIIEFVACVIPRRGATTNSKLGAKKFRPACTWTGKSETTPMRACTKWICGSVEKLSASTGKRSRLFLRRSEERRVGKE